MRKAIIYFFTAICLLSCKSSDRVPKNIIKPEKMKSILWDVMRAQSLAQETAAKDTTLSVATQTKILSQKVFEIHKTDSVRFAQSYNWYVKHPEKLKLIFDSLYAQKQRTRELNLLQKEHQAGHPLENKSTNVK
jgi:Leucine-rich repeat (LRR) protein